MAELLQIMSNTLKKKHDVILRLKNILKKKRNYVALNQLKSGITL